jgi:hypothetical protein
MDELGIAHDPAQHVLKRLVGLYGAAQRRAVDIRQFALIPLLEGLRLRRRPLEVGRQGRRVRRRVEIPQIPFGHRADGGVGGRGGCIWTHLVSLMVE